MINRLIKNEDVVSSKINIISHYDDVTLLDKNDRLIQIIKVNGLDFVTQDDQVLDTYKVRLNHLLKNFSSEFAWYVWDVRRKSDCIPSGEFPEGYARELNIRYCNNVQSAELFVNDLYLAIITKQPEGLFNQGLSFAQQFTQRFDKESRQQYIKRRHLELCDVTNKVMHVMSDYGCELLSVYGKNGVKLSAPLEFVSTLINGYQFPVPLVSADISRFLPRKRIFFNHRSGTIEFRSADGSSKYAAMLSIKGYCPHTEQGLLNELRSLRCEYTITQSFRFINSTDAKRKMRDQQMEMSQSRDESLTQIEELDEALDDTASGTVGLGLHHLTVCVYADELDILSRHINSITAKFADLDIACVREDVASECSFWAQLPANFGYILRSAHISTMNFAGLSSFHNFDRGRINGNHWGEAVSVFETQAGTPYCFNFHYKDVGNFQVFGAMGSGKTALIGFLIAQSMKFSGKRVIFDKDRGLEIFVRAMGGVYEEIKLGMPTGFNPCQLDHTAENRAFLVQLFKRMLTTNNEVLSAADMDVILSAVDGLYRLDRSDRQLRHLASYFGRKESGSLRHRFDQWHSGGEQAWLFDNAKDTLSLNADVLGFDLGKILNHQECKTPALMYLTHRVEQALAGKRGMLFCDEGWSMLNDPYFRKLIENWSRVSRKLDNIFGLATQVANDTIHSSISKAINESSFCKIFFANPSADLTIYKENYGLTQREVEIIRTLPDNEHFFLLVHGHGESRKSIVVRPVLQGMWEDLLILSARENSLMILDQVRAKVGDDPGELIPEFLIRMRGAA